MRILFLARSVPPGDAGKEVIWSILIMLVIHFIGFGMVEVIYRIDHMAYADAAEVSGWIGGVATFIYFRIVGFRLLFASTIALGAGLIIIAPYQAGIWISIAEWIGGFMLILRGFSEGPALRTSA